MVSRPNKHRRGKTRRLNTLTRRLLGPALHRRGISLEKIVTDWPKIAGEAASWSEPAMIRFPDGESRNGTLTVSIRSGRGPEMQMRSHEIIENCNTVFGYGAISRISLTQTVYEGVRRGMRRGISVPLARRRAQPLAEAEAKRIETGLRRVRDENIRKALDSLGKSIFTRRG